MNCRKRHILIKGKKYSVSVIPNFEKRFGNNCDGICDLDKKKIYIDGTASNERRQHVLLHEIFHAMFHENSLYQVVPHSTEEIIVDQCASLMMDLFFNKK